MSSRPGRAVPAPRESGRRRPALPQPGRRHLRGRHRTRRPRPRRRRLRPRRRRRRLRQRRPARPVRHPMAGLRAHHNRGDGTFEDVTDRAGLGGDRDWPTSAAFADLDGDGDLDLYVCHYLVVRRQEPAASAPSRSPVNHYCNPQEFRRRCPDHVFRNDGGRFVDVTAGAGLRRPGRARAGRGRGRPRRRRPHRPLRRQRHDGQLPVPQPGRLPVRGDGVDAGAAAKPAAASRRAWGSPAATSTATAGSTWPSPTTTASRPRSSGTWAAALFADQTAAIGLAAPSRYLLGFGIAFLDANNDGRLDLISANGHVIDYRPAFPWKMPTQLLRAGPAADWSTSRPAPAPRSSPSTWAAAWPPATSTTTAGSTPSSVCQNEPLVYFHNRTAGRPLRHVPARRGTSNRDGVGARSTSRRAAAGGWRSGSAAEATVGQRPPPPLRPGGFGAGRAAGGSVAVGRVDRYEGWPSTGVPAREGDARRSRSGGDRVPVTAGGWPSTRTASSGNAESLLWFISIEYRRIIDRGGRVDRRRRPTRRSLVWWSGALRGLTDPASRAVRCLRPGPLGRSPSWWRVEVLKLRPQRTLPRLTARRPGHRPGSGLDDKAIALYGQQIAPGAEW